MSRLHDLFGISDFAFYADDIGDSGAGTMWTPGPDAPGVAATASVAGNAVSAPTNVLYLTEPGTGAAISVSDINQGQIGNCFLLSPIGDFAMLKPSFISNMIHVNSNGTETVTLYEAGNGQLPSWNTTAFRPVSEVVTNVFPGYSVNNGATQDVYAGQKEIWPQVLEKALATLDGGYGAIAGGGSPLVAMEELTGHATSYMAPAAMTWTQLASLSAAGDLLVFDTKASGALGNGLVNGHAYMFEGVSGTGAGATVRLGNPWGFDQPTPVLVTQLARSFAEIDIGHIA